MAAKKKAGRTGGLQIFEKQGGRRVAINMATVDSIEEAGNVKVKGADVAEFHIVAGGVRYAVLAPDASLEDLIGGAAPADED